MQTNFKSADHNSGLLKVGLHDIRKSGLHYVLFLIFAFGGPPFGRIIPQPDSENQLIHILTEKFIFIKFN